MGFLGPRRIAFDQDGQVSQFPAPIADNDYSVLDITDLVFIDPVGTGYSRPVEGVDLSNFIGYENDNRTVGDFIRLYINRYGRWSSPKYLAGESYGTIRAIGLAKYLSDRYSLGLNGIMLISSVNDFTTMMENTPSDYTYALYLPTYAADAWYHGRLAPQYQDMKLEDLLEEVRAFAGGEYLSALFAGRRLDDARREEVASRIAVYTGLDREDILKANLRVLYWDFCEKLLSDKRLVIGRIDGQDRARQRLQPPRHRAALRNRTQRPKRERQLVELALQALGAARVVQRSLRHSHGYNVVGPALGSDVPWVPAVGFCQVDAIGVRRHGPPDRAALRVQAVVPVLVAVHVTMTGHCA